MVLEDARLPSVLLALHGAMVSESDEDAEGLVLERVREYCAAELSRAALEKAVERDQNWQQKRSQLFVHITGKGKTKKELDRQEVWAGRARRHANALELAGTPEGNSPRDLALAANGMSVHTMGMLRARSDAVTRAMALSSSRRRCWRQGAIVRGLRGAQNVGCSPARGDPARCCTSLMTLVTDRV